MHFLPTCLLATSLIASLTSALPTTNNETPSTTDTPATTIQIRKTHANSPAARQQHLNRVVAKYVRTAVNASKKRPSTKTFKLVDEGDQEWTVNATLSNGQVVTMDLDTGSSDTWVINSDYCVAYPGDDSCTYGAASQSDLIANGSNNTGKAFWITYGLGANAGDVLKGPISIGSLKANIAYGLSTINMYSGGNNGLMGLAYDSLSTITQYTGEMANWFDGLGFHPSKQRFGFYLGNAADGDYGEVTFGGSDHSKYNTSALQWVPLNSETYYQMDITPWTYKVGSAHGPLGNATNAANGGQDGIVDTGTTLIYLPTGSSMAIIKALGSFYNASQDTYYIDCHVATKTDPVVEFIYNKTVTYHLYPKTYVVPNGDGTCSLGIQPGADTGGSIFGDVFIRNVYTIFDKYSKKLGFAQAIHPHA
ncbi:hypothetical protein HDU76_010972 [Blyttiomyces sp. JEL0837]|nr:hypothetical protein HDU76_010972 [Blyttiomyces sp. JEL0837]